tara:strand:- start:574 stop:1407 length:834 start_codon:yes stop_codon:yes gene_type:complete
MIRIVYYFVSILITSCGSSESKYFVKGVVKKIPSDSMKIIIAHDTIPNLMMPMVMPFSIKTKSIAKNLEIGDSVHFDFIWEQTNPYAKNFLVVGKSNKEFEDDDFFEDKQFSERGIGELIDDITLLDLDSIEVKLLSSDGLYRFISFIFTRCPMPNMCPAVVSKNVYLANSFKEKQIQFLMISFDYVYDTPEVLRKFYGYLLDGTPNLNVLSSTGHVEGVYQLAKQVGCSFWGVDENKIGHTLRSVLVSPDRELLASWPGDDWNTEEVENVLKILME